jgi:hypothetical protein
MGIISMRGCQHFSDVQFWGNRICTEGNEKYNLMYLPAKQIVDLEEPKADNDAKKTGKIKMDPGELPPIDPSIYNHSRKLPHAITFQAAPT